METLAYDCGNPVQYVCGRMPAVLFYLLDRHALLAMTMGSKCIFLKSLTTPALRATPPQRGTYSATERTKFPSIGGVSAGRGGYCTPPPDGLTTATPRQRRWAFRCGGWALFHCAGLGVFICAGGVLIKHAGRGVHNARTAWAGHKATGGCAGGRIARWT